MGDTKACRNYFDQTFLQTYIKKIYLYLCTKLVQL